MTSATRQYLNKIVSQMKPGEKCEFSQQDERGNRYNVVKLGKDEIIPYFRKLHSCKGVA